jgi:hypothetical protein
MRECRVLQQRCGRMGEGNGTTRHGANSDFKEVYTVVL